jgi:hypothetical protein
MTSQELTISKSSAISQILYKGEDNSFDITFTSGSTANYGAGTAENFLFCRNQFMNTKSVGKTFHGLVSSGKLSVNGIIV